MPHVTRFALALIACLSGATSSVGAAGPALFMVSGGGLERPIFLVAKDLETYQFMTCNGGYDLRPAPLPDGVFVDVAIFWNREIWRDPSSAGRIIPTLRPEMAGQHARLYLPRDGRPATVLVTKVTHVVAARSNGEAYEWGHPSPVPLDAAAFEGGCPVSASSAAVARAAGIVGF